MRSQFSQILAVAGTFALCISASAQVLEDFETAPLGNGTMFNSPTFSGSTSSLLEPSPSVSRVILMPSPRSTIDLNSRQVLEANFEFLWDKSEAWTRLTTFNTARRPNPFVDINKKLRIQLFVNAPVRLALGLREVSGTGAIGANGGTSGSIEWVANSGLNATGKPGGLLVSAGTWTTVEFDLPSIPRGASAPGQVRNFVGDGMLNSAGGYTLEHLAISTESGNWTVQMFIDKFEQVP